MSSPSRSKSVPMTTLSAFLARFLRARMISFSAGSFSMGAHTRYGRLAIFQPLRSTPSARKGLRRDLYGGRARPSGTSAGMSSPSAVRPCQPSRSLKVSCTGKSTFRMCPRRPMVTQSSPPMRKRYTGVL